MSSCQSLEFSLILLTGSNGFIGKHIRDYFILNSDTTIICPPRQPILGRLWPSKSLLKEYELTNLDANTLSQIEICIHAGGYVKHNHNEMDDFSSAYRSLFLTRALLNYPMPNLKKFIYLSSMDVYDRSQQFIQEDSRTQATNLYQTVKLISEQLVQDAFCDSSVSVDILRIGHVFGPGDSKFGKMLQNMIKAVKSGNTFFLETSLSQVLNLIYVQDLVRYLFLLCQSSMSYGITNVVSSNTITVSELIELISALSGSILAIQKTEHVTLQTFDYPFTNSKLFGTGLFAETPFKEALRLSYF